MIVRLGVIISFTSTTHPWLNLTNKCYESYIMSEIRSKDRVCYATMRQAETSETGSRPTVRHRQPVCSSSMRHQPSVPGRGSNRTRRRAPRSAVNSTARDSVIGNPNSLEFVSRVAFVRGASSALGGSVRGRRYHGRAASHTLRSVNSRHLRTPHRIGNHLDKCFVRPPVPLPADAVVNEVFPSLQVSDVHTIDEISVALDRDELTCWEPVVLAPLNVNAERVACVDPVDKFLPRKLVFWHGFFGTQAGRRHSAGRDFSANNTGLSLFDTSHRGYLVSSENCEKILRTPIVFFLNRSPPFIGYLIKWIAIRLDLLNPVFIHQLVEIVRESSALESRTTHSEVSVNDVGCEGQIRLVQQHEDLLFSILLTHTSAVRSEFISTAGFVAFLNIETLLRSVHIFYEQGKQLSVPAVTGSVCDSLVGPLGQTKTRSAIARRPASGSLWSKPIMTIARAGHKSPDVSSVAQPPCCSTGATAVVTPNHGSHNDA